MAMDSVATTHREGQSIVRPSLFVGENYFYWKNRIKLFVQANDYEAWRIIANTPYKPMKTIVGRQLIKEEKE
ncbi:Uncharacterized protein TCM_035893 [Theobroma cacao]|uniref:Uncharacterized protein n=1 Tax=Theobroma cacao TaxID=3641 RepID=A0A061FIJ7_THECC|nr:Uncharacterized protein TCM_035893 [Theobroma cacao]